MKIGIVDDHVLIMDAYSLVLNDYVIVVKAVDGLDMIEKMDRLDKSMLPDILIVDINMPKMNGFETVAWLKANYSDVKIIVATMRDDDYSILRMMKLGVTCFLSKHELTMETFIYAVKEVSEKGCYYTSRVAETVVKSFQNSNIDNNEMKLRSLTEKEIKVLQMICQEQASIEISEKLNVSLRTVETIVKGMLDKLGVKNRIGLALFAQKNGLLS